MMMWNTFPMEKFVG